jgi:hypothetical protein
MGLRHLSFDGLWLKPPPLMDHGEHIAVCPSCLVNDAVGVYGDFSNILLTKFRNYATGSRQRPQDFGLFDDVLQDLPGVELRIMSDEIVDGANQLWLGAPKSPLLNFAKELLAGGELALVDGLLTLANLIDDVELIHDCLHVGVIGELAD